MERAFPAKLREARVALGYSQKEVAEKSGISPSAMSSYERGDKYPPLDTAFRIAKALNVSLDWLCGSPSVKNGLQLETFGDVVRTLHALEESGLQIAFDYDEDYYIPNTFLSSEERNDLTDKCRALGFDPGDVSENQVGHAVLKISGLWFSKLFSRWKVFREQYVSGGMDAELYDAWLEKQFAQGDEISLPIG